MKLLHFFSRNIYIPICWTLGIQILVCLPGSAIPGSGWLDAIHFDKIIHVILFGGLVFLWSLYLNRSGSLSAKNIKWPVGIFLLSCANGILLEYIQKYYIPNRSFDLYDIIADICGALLGLLLSFIYFTKPRSI